MSMEGGGVAYRSLSFTQPNADSGTAAPPMDCDMPKEDGRIQCQVMSL